MNHTLISTVCTCTVLQYSGTIKLSGYLLQEHLKALLETFSYAFGSIENKMQ